MCGIQPSNGGVERIFSYFKILVEGRRNPFKVCETGLLILRPGGSSWEVGRHCIMMIIVRLAESKNLHYAQFEGVAKPSHIHYDYGNGVKK